MPLGSSFNAYWVYRSAQTGSVYDLGYAAVNRELMRYASSRGFGHNDKSPVAVHVCNPQFFRPIRSKLNILFTMWENEDFPETERPYLATADHVVVPSQFCARIFKPYTNRLSVVPLGTDPTTFTYASRRWKLGERPFQWLIVGAPNARKGYDVIQDIFNTKYADRTSIELYIKTTGPREAVDAAKTQGFAERMPGVVVKRNVLIDFRQLPTWALVKTYHNAEGFLFPTAGEGFGLTLLEALGTGLPAVVTRYSGVLDFTDNKSVKYVEYGTTSRVNTETSIIADPVQVVAAMEEIMADYGAARRMGKRASRLAHSFTWDNAGEQFVQVLRAYL